MISFWLFHRTIAVTTIKRGKEREKRLRLWRPMIVRYLIKLFTIQIDSISCRRSPLWIISHSLVDCVSISKEWTDNNFANIFRQWSDDVSGTHVTDSSSIQLHNRISIKLEKFRLFLKWLIQSKCRSPILDSFGRWSTNNVFALSKIKENEWFDWKTIVSTFMKDTWREEYLKLSPTFTCISRNFYIIFHFNSQLRLHNQTSRQRSWPGSSSLCKTNAIFNLCVSAIRLCVCLSR